MNTARAEASLSDSKTKHVVMQKDAVQRELVEFVLRIGELDTTLQELGLLSVISSYAQWTCTRARVWRSLQADASQHLHSAKTCKLIARRGPTTSKEGMEESGERKEGDYVSVCFFFFANMWKDIARRSSTTTKEEAERRVQVFTSYRTNFGSVVEALAW